MYKIKHIWNKLYNILFPAIIIESILGHLYHFNIHLFEGMYQFLNKNIGQLSAGLYLLLKLAVLIYFLIEKKR